MDLDQGFQKTSHAFDFAGRSGFYWSLEKGICHSGQITPPKTNMDTLNDGLEDVSPFKHGYFGYLC